MCERPEGAARAIEEHRVFGDGLGEDALHQAGDEHRVECQAACRLDGSHEHAAVSTPWRGRRDGAQTLVEDPAHLVEVEGAHGSQGLELGKGLEHGLRVDQRVARQIAQRGEPVAPSRAIGEGSKTGDERQCKRLEMGEVGHASAKGGHLRLVALAKALELAQHLLAKPLQASRPAVCASQYRGVDEQLLPAPGGS